MTRGRLGQNPLLGARWSFANLWEDRSARLAATRKAEDAVRVMEFALSCRRRTAQAGTALTPPHIWPDRWGGIDYPTTFRDHWRRSIGGMNTNSDAKQWEEARLIPVSGIRSADEQERRASSALLAVLAAVKEFGAAITKPLGAPGGHLECYIETPFEMSDGHCVRPDGLIRVSRGKKTWTALVEVKTGRNQLDRAQVETYLDLVREQAFDCVITISNQIARIPGQHPVDVDKRKLRRAALHHMSWSRLLTEAMLQKSHRGVADPDQAWILGGLIRYLEHENAGAVDFSDMGEYWVSVRDAVKNGTLRQSDKKAVEIAGKWEELVSFAALQLGRKLGADVQEVLTAKERADISLRIGAIVDSMVTRGIMPGRIRIPDTVGDVSLEADLRAQQVVASVSLKAPKSGRPTTRINWLLRQLKASSTDIRLDCWGLRSRSSMSELLGNVRKNPGLLVPIDNREIVSFTVSLARPMGMKRSVGRRSFIGSVLQTLGDFYGEVVEHLKEWQAPAPKLQKDRSKTAEAGMMPQSAPEATGPGECAGLEGGSTLQDQKEHDSDSSL